MNNKSNNQQLLAAPAPIGLNPAWFNPQYWVDHQNVSGCASQRNDGLVQGCSGAGAGHGPITSLYDLYSNRWKCNGGFCPRFEPGNGVNTQTINIMSDDTDETINWEITASAAFVLYLRGTLGTPQQVSTGTLTSFTGKNRAGVTLGQFASGLNWAAILGSTLNYTNLIKDITNSSVFFPYYDITTAGGAAGLGDKWAFSQPFTPFVGTLAVPPYVTIAANDNVTVYKPPRVNINTLYGHIGSTSNGSAIAQNVVVQDLIVGTNSGATINTNNGVSWVEDIFVSGFSSIPGSNGIAVLINDAAPLTPVDFNNFTAGFGGQQNYVIGGIYGVPQTSNQNSLTTDGAQWDGDLIIGQTPGVYGGSLSNFAGQVYVDGGEGILVYPGAQLDLELSTYGTAILWGNGSIQALNGASIHYSIGAGQACTIFQQKSLISLWYGGNVYNAGCWDDPVNAGARTCNHSTTCAALDAFFGSTLRCIQAGVGGGVICN